MNAIHALAPLVGLVAACSALDVSRSTVYRRQEATCAPPRPSPPRALSPEERQAVLDVANSERFLDVAPAEILATLLDEGVYHCSTRTMYRILAEADEVRERRNQLRHPEYKKPELLATGPNQVWSWDITKLLRVDKWRYFYLYVIIDVYSRYAVGWLLAEHENAELAKRLIRETCKKHDIEEDQLTIHSDRGAPMTSKTMAQLLTDLAITQSHSRPQVSNDNPFSESQFKTMKYRPDFPDRFSDASSAREHCRGFFDWYNNHHRHSGIAFCTPADVHFGRAPGILAQRQAALDAAHAAHPERFVRRPPRVAPLPEAVWINPPKPTTETERSNELIRPPPDASAAERDDATGLADGATRSRTPATLAVPVAAPDGDDAIGLADGATWRRTSTTLTAPATAPDGDHAIGLAYGATRSRTPTTLTAPAAAPDGDDAIGLAYGATRSRMPAILAAPVAAPDDDDAIGLADGATRRRMPAILATPVAALDDDDATGPAYGAAWSRMPAFLAAMAAAAAIGLPEAVARSDTPTVLAAPAAASIPVRTSAVANSVAQSRVPTTLTAPAAAEDRSDAPGTAEAIAGPNAVDGVSAVATDRGDASVHRNDASTAIASSPAGPGRGDRSGLPEPQDGVETPPVRDTRGELRPAIVEAGADHEPPNGRLRAAHALSSRPTRTARRDCGLYPHAGGPACGSSPLVLGTDDRVLGEEEVTQ